MNNVVRHPTRARTLLDYRRRHVCHTLRRYGVDSALPDTKQDLNRKKKKNPQQKHQSPHNLPLGRDGRSQKGLSA